MDNIPLPPMDLPPEMYIFCQALRNAVVANIQPTVVPPGPVTNLGATPGPGSNYIQFTRSDGEIYVLYVNDQPELNGAVRYDLGKGNTFMHDIGKASELRYYWVKAKIGQLESAPVGPVSATTLALNTGITIPAEVPASETLTQSNIDDAVVPGRPTGLRFDIDL